MSATKRLGSVADEHERLGADVGNLIVVFGAKEYDFVFLDDTLFAFEGAATFRGSMAETRRRQPLPDFGKAAVMTNTARSLREHCGVFFARQEYQKPISLNSSSPVNPER